jgi:hypothetical protein
MEMLWLCLSRKKMVEEFLRRKKNLGTQGEVERVKINIMEKNNKKLDGARRGEYARTKSSELGAGSY